jgi:hypothetical protein
VNVNEIDDDIVSGPPSATAGWGSEDVVQEDDILFAQAADMAEGVRIPFIIPTATSQVSGSIPESTGTVRQVSQNGGSISPDDVIPEWDCDIPTTPRSLATNCFDDLWSELG